MRTVWAARAGFSKEHRGTLSHHATALNGSDIVYSRELQTGAIRKLQMLLKKIRVGLDPRSDKEPLHEITAAFDSGHRSVVRTPVFEADAPCTPMPVAEFSREQQDAHTECKVETSLHDLCMIASSETAPFGDVIRDQGLIAIDSSSGNTSTDSNSDDDDSSDDFFFNCNADSCVLRESSRGFQFSCAQEEQNHASSSVWSLSHRLQNDTE